MDEAAISTIQKIIVGTSRVWPCRSPISGLKLLLAVRILMSCVAARGDEPPGEPSSKIEPASQTLSLQSTSSDKTQVDSVCAATLELMRSFPATTVPPTLGAARSTASGERSHKAADGTAIKTEPSTSTPASSVASPAPPLAPPHALLDERIQLLDEYDNKLQAIHKVTHPEKSPEDQMATAAAEARQLEAVLKRAVNDPDTLLPPLFRGSAIDGSRTLPLEMKGALESTENDVKKWKLELENANGQIQKAGIQQDARRKERDRLSHSLTALKARREEFESAVTDALSAESRQLARERLVNFEWELKVQALTLQLVEAQLVAESKLAEVRSLAIMIDRAHIKIGTATLAQMQDYFGQAVLAQETDLKKQAAAADEQAAHAKDPLEKYRLQRSAELLRLEIVVLKYEHLSAANPRPSYDEQKALADHADDDFARIKELLADGNVSRLDAVRLNNEFRRLGPERDRLVKDELATVEAHIQFYEGVLTGVEIDLMQGGLHDLERDMVHERLPPARHAQADGVLNVLDHRHRGLLIRQRDALDNLAKRGGHTLQQILRRLDYLDSEYGFIRTSIFWVRDQEPISLTILTQLTLEFRHLAKGAIRLAQESIDGKLWLHPTGEFLLMALAACALPVGLIRLRKLLKLCMSQELPSPQV